MALLPRKNRDENPPDAPAAPNDPMGGLEPPSARKSGEPLKPGGVLRRPGWGEEDAEDPGFVIEKPSAVDDAPVYEMTTEEPPLPGRLRPVGAPPPAAPPAESRPPGAGLALRGVEGPGDEVRERIRSWLRQAVEMGASDLHLSRGVPPIVRMDGNLRALNKEPLGREAINKMVLSLLNRLQREKFERDWELDLSVEVPGVGRFRTNVHKVRGGIEAAFRVVNNKILPLRRLGLPPVVEEVARKLSGLVIVTGATGSGKSTTLAAMVDQINDERAAMIVTVEDPIEYLHTNRRCIIKQREVTSDTQSFGQALRHVLRQDPDIIVIGEMRDLETIGTALTAAETGHLVLTTLHTPDATQTVDRIVDVFPPHQQEQVRLQVANSIQAVVSQQLVPMPNDRGRVLAVEVLIANNAVRKIVRSGKTEQLYTTMQTSWESGMITMDKSLKTLHQQGLISYEEAISRAKFPAEFGNL